MGVNPCCCCGSLQRGVIILAVIEIILAIVTLATRVFAIVRAINEKNENDMNQEDKDENTATIITVAVNLVISVLSLLLALRLYFGARKRDRKNCTIWLAVTTVITVITIIILVVNLVLGKANMVEVPPTIVDIVYNLYMMWCVFAFIQELKKDGIGMTRTGRV